MCFVYMVLSVVFCVYLYSFVVFVTLHPPKRAESVLTWSEIYLRSWATHTLPPYSFCSVTLLLLIDRFTIVICGFVSTKVFQQSILYSFFPFFLHSLPFSFRRLQFFCAFGFVFRCMCDCFVVVVVVGVYCCCQFVSFVLIWFPSLEHLLWVFLSIVLASISPPRTTKKTSATAIL